MVPNLALLLAAVVPCGDVAANQRTTGQKGDAELAPDGHRGFGAQPDARALAHLFRSPENGDAGFIAHLFGLEGDVSVLLALVRSGYRQRGYFDLFEYAERDRASVLDLHARWEEMPRLLARGKVDRDAATALVRLLDDVRFELRRRAAEGVAADRRELRGALALFTAHFHGHTDLEADSELALVAERADLAAARLRALRLDLEALHEVPRGLEEKLLGPEEEEVAASFAGGGPSARELFLERQRELGKRADRMAADLFTTRLATRIAAKVDERRRGIDRAKRIVTQAKALLPSEANDDGASPAVRDMRQSQRYRMAAEGAREALRLDPFDREAAYVVALANDFVASIHVAIPFYDRFLALGGIRHYDQRSYEWDALDERERHALAVVSRWRAEDGK